MAGVNLLENPKQLMLLDKVGWIGNGNRFVEKTMRLFMENLYMLNMELVLQDMDLTGLVIYQVIHL